MPKRENTTDGGSATDFVRYSSNTAVIEGGEGLSTSSSSSININSFNHLTPSLPSSSLSSSSAELTATNQSKRARFNQQQQQLNCRYSNSNLVILTQQQRPTVATMSVSTATTTQPHSSSSNGSPANSLINGSNGGCVAGDDHHDGQSPSLHQPNGGDNTKNTTSSSSSSSSSYSHLAADNTIVDLITDNANYKVMDGVQVSKTNLIVNYVPQQMSQDDLQKLFERFGTLETCKLVRDKTTNLSLGYAFVNFQRAEDAEKAINNANGMRIQNKSLKVSYARPSTEDIKGANLYVSGIPKTWTEHDLKRFFYGHGRIITGRILVDNKTGLSKGVGFIRFDTREEANAAIQALNNTTPEGCEEAVTVKFANNPTHTPSHAGGGNILNGNILQLNNNGNRQQLHNNLLAMGAAALINQQQQQQQARRASSGGLLNGSALLSPLGTSALNPMAAAAAAAAVASGRLRGGSIGGTNTFSGAAGGGFDADLLASTLLSAGANPAIAAALLAAGGLGPAVSNGCGPVHHNNQFAGLGQSMMGGNTGCATFATPANNSSGAAATNGSGGYCLFVYNLPPDAEESLLWQLFGPFGAVQSVKVGFTTTKDTHIPVTSSYKDREFLVFSIAYKDDDPYSCSLPVPKLGGLQQAPVDRPSASARNANRLWTFPGGLPTERLVSFKSQLTAKFVRILIGPFCVCTQIVRDNITQRCKGFGFVTMVTYTDALNAMQNLDGYSLAGRPLQVKPRTQRGGSIGGNSMVGGVV